MKDFRFVDHILFLVGYFMVSIIFTLLDTSFLSIWLGINVVLAGIPFLLIMFITKRFIEKDYTLEWVNVVLLLLFIFFLPNAFYVITDFIHLSSLEFYVDVEYGTRVYSEVIEHYVLLTHILFSALIGIYYAARSLMRVELILKELLHKRRVHTIMFILMILSSIGIYIGRFLRLFSWDILNPFNVVQMFFDDITVFTLWFVLLFTIIQYALFFIFKLLLPEEPLK